MPEIAHNLPASQYHGRKALSKSGLDQFRKSPAHFRAWQDGTSDQEVTSAMEFGTAAHMSVLEPELFYKRYKLFTSDRRAKEGKAEYQGIVDSGMIPLAPDTWDSLVYLATSVHAHPAAASALNSCTSFEVSYFDTWNDIAVKARIDGLSQDAIIDLKTTQDASPQAFGKSVAQFRYHVQAAWYQRITGINRFIFIAVEKEAPFGVACYELDQQAIDLGNEIIDSQLSLFRECQHLNSWPCYASTVQSLSLPAWAARQDPQQ